MRNSELETCNIRNDIIIRYLKLDGQNNNVLDFGCGNGRISRILAETVPEIKVIGYDISPARIKIAKRLHWTIFPDNIDFTFSPEKVNENKPYDHVVSSFVLDTLEESTPEILKSFHSLLAPEGILIMFFYNIKGQKTNRFSFNTGEEINTIRNMGLEESLKRWSGRDVSDYTRSVQDAGFAILKTDKIPQNQNKYAYLIAQKK